MLFRDTHKEIKEKLDQFLSLNYIESVPKFKCEPSFFREEKRSAPQPIQQSVCASYSRMPASNMDSFLETTFDENGVAKKLNLYMYERDITTAMIYDLDTINDLLYQYHQPCLGA